jgi:invasion protein IalB
MPKRGWKGGTVVEFRRVYRRWPGTPPRGLLHDDPVSGLDEVPLMMKRPQSFQPPSARATRPSQGTLAEVSEEKALEALKPPWKSRKAGAEIESTGALMSRVLPKAARSIRLLFAAGALLILASGAPIAGKAQAVEGNRGAQNVWSKLCFDAPIGQSNTGSASPAAPAASQTVEACYTYVYMYIRDQPTDIPIGIIGVLHAPALDRILLVALLPLDYLLPSEPGYLVFQDGSRIKLSYLGRDACDHSGCYAKAELSESLLEHIKTAKALSFGNEYVTGRSLSVALACCGFAEAFAGAPVPACAHDEMQRGIVEVLVRRFHEFIQ